MREFALTNSDLAYYGEIFCYRKAENEKQILQMWIDSNDDFKDCKIIKKPKGVILKYGAKYCFKCHDKWWYAYELS